MEVEQEKDTRSTSTSRSKCSRSKFNKLTKRREKSFTDALKEKYCCNQVEPSFDFIIISRKQTNDTDGLTQLCTVVLNDMDIVRAGLPDQGLVSLCPNVVDLDLANNLFDHWSEMLDILSGLPNVRYVNISGNRLKLHSHDTLPPTPLSVENLVLNETAVPIEEVIHLSQIMPDLQELHLCGNSYEGLSCIEHSVREGALPSLKCLRLNNNQITSWSEVWKLRHLPQLENLILSGNPLRAIFYNDFDPSDSDRYDAPEVNEVAAQMRGPEKSENDHPSYPHLHNTGDLPSAPCNSSNTEEGTNHQLRQYDGRTESQSSDNELESHCEEDMEQTSAVCACCKNSCDHSTCVNHIVQDVNCSNSFCASFEKPLFDNRGTLDEDSVVGEGDDGSGFELMHGSGNNEDEEAWHRAIAEAFLLDIVDSLSLDVGSSTNPREATEELLSSGSDDFSHSSSTQVSSDTEVIGSGTESGSAVCANLTGRSAQDDTNKDTKENTCSLSIGVTEQSSLSQELINTIHSDGCGQMSSGSSTQSVKISRHQSELCKGVAEPVREHQEKEAELDSCNDCRAVVGENTGKSSERLHLETEDIVGVREVSCEQEFSQRQNDFIERISGEGTISAVSQVSSQRADNYHNQTIASDSQDHIIHPQDQAVSQNSMLYDQNVLEQGCESDRGLNKMERQPFKRLDTLCLSDASLSHWSHLDAFAAFPSLTNLRVMNNPLYSNIKMEDRRKLYIASLPKITVLNGSEVSGVERMNSERFYLRHFMDQEEKPQVYHTLVSKHGPPVRLVDINLRAGYHEWATLTVSFKGEVRFTHRFHLVEKLKNMRHYIAERLDLPTRSAVLYHNMCGPAHPESEREIMELRCDMLPLSRFDFVDGDEIRVEKPSFKFQAHCGGM